MIDRISTKFRNIYQLRYEHPEIACINPEYAYTYATIKKLDKFKLGESAIATNPIHSMLYAYFVLNGRFELGEPTIANSAFESYRYAILVLKSRFYLGEQTTLLNENSKSFNSYFTNLYKQYFKID